MQLTNFFIKRPCVAICVPYFLLIVFAVIAFTQNMFDVYMEGQDDGLVMSDPIVIDSNIIKEASATLNKKEAGVEKKREDQLKSQVRYETSGFNTIFMLYEAVSDSEFGLLDLKAVKSIISLEQQVLAWDKVSNNFKNEKFNGEKVTWNQLCFAGEGAAIDPRTGSAKCDSAASYASPLRLWVETFKEQVGPDTLKGLSLAEE